ncbi:PepSY-like domain-containing protein [Winogradskyella bathintestinalis]|uniref:PepSY-like domain-containing protein n=1 Tax=Winogradskyella bathintestinalis TaxID=3035208 RepID=A0ABT7ZSN5_9FLAO|nr:PepSY-like domain-containing protein [Winogradskyella bathintestinalis]MDN3492025.1 PepSY-like domain-containing protein [Winogradskyella bathintestinalis]
MKTLKITTLAIFATIAMNAQDLKMNEVPSNLMTNFQNTYKTASDVEWEKEGMNYKVEFDMKKVEHEIWYTKDGNVVKSEMEVTERDLPAAISTAIKNDYAGYKIDGIEVTEMENKKTYEVELEKGWTKEMKVIFDANGKVLSSIED